MDRSVLIGPVAGAVIGGAAGVCWAMLFCYELGDYARVPIGDGLRCMLTGAALGHFAGWLVWDACQRVPRLVPFATLLVTALLGAGLLGPMGWMAANPPPVRLVGEGMRDGAVEGAVVGFILGAVQCVIDRRKRRAQPMEPQPPATLPSPPA